MRLFPVLIILFFVPLLAAAQEVTAPEDTAKFYKDLYRYSKERKFTYKLYKAIFNVPKDPVNAKLDKRSEDKSFSKKLEGRVIRSISIQTLEPFGNSLTDTSQHAHSFVQRAGNTLHIETQRRVVRNKLLFKEGDQLNRLQVVESERLLRQSEFIRDAKIKVIPVSGSSDSVDVLVSTQDLWTFSPSLTITGSRIKFRFTEYNFLGIGHRLSNNLVYNYSHPSTEPIYTEGSYLINNIANTYISSEVVYRFLENDNLKGIAFSRPFYSTLTNWAGGTSVFNRTIKDSIEFKETGFENYKYSSWISNAWLGRSFVIKKGSTMEEKETKGVVSLGYTRTRYSSLEPRSPNLVSYFVPVNLYLISVGLTNRKYFTDRYIFGFGEKEDVPTGRLLELTTGYEERGVVGRNYFDASIGSSSYIGNSGYLSSRFSFSTFISNRGFTQGIIKADFFAFSRLFQFHQAKIRWFGYSNFTYGLNRNSGEFIYLRTGNGVPGFRAEEPYGNTRFSLNVRVLFFNRLEWLGFRFTPVLFAAMGMVGDEATPLYNAKVYKGFGAGVAVTNVFLIQSNFEILIGFYPDINSSRLRFNPVDVWNFKYRDYAFDKPEVIPFE